jgi:hypothetical protein
MKMRLSSARFAKNTAAKITSRQITSRQITGLKKQSPLAGALLDTQTRPGV